MLRSVREFWSHQMSYVCCTIFIEKISDRVNRLLVMLSYFRAVSESNTDLNLTLISPSIDRSSVHWFARVSSRMRTTVF